MSKTKRLLAALVALAISIPTAAVITPATASAAVGQGFTVTPSDLAYILKQIKIAEAHVANTTSETGPCGALVGTGPNQLSSPLLSFGLRTVDGSCNNLVAGKEKIGAADELFPRLSTPLFQPAGPVPPAFGPPGSTSYAQTSGNVFDTEPRVVSNLIVDQTSTNPAAIAAAGFPVRTQGNQGTVPCTTEPNDLVSPPTPGVPADCTPAFKTLFIPNVTTDVGLSPPYNSLFTLFGQFFDHGIDQTVKGGSGTVFVPLKDDDPLVAGKDHIFGNTDDLDPNLRFMVLTRGTNQPGPDGVLGTSDDIRDTKNTDSPWVDQSQTYTSHASHQAFLREYMNNSAGRPVATGKLLGGPAVAGVVDTGMATWATTKAQARTLLGLALADKDVLNIPMLAVDPYGKFIPGPDRGLPQYVTATGLVEGNTAAPVPVPANVRYFDTPFLTDIANNAAPNPGLVPDADSVASADFASQPAGTYDDEMLNAHFIAGDGRVNENIGLTAIHQVFHSEHDRLIDYIENVLTTDTSASGVAALAEWKSATGAAGWNGERLFQAARFVTEMEYQHLVFEEFARKVQPAINPFEPFAFTQPDLNPAIRAEFAHAVYRFGHSMLTETIARTNENGSKNDISLLKGFLNPPSYTQGGAAGNLTPAAAAGSIIMGMSDQVGNELDEFVTDTLRNNLLGLPLDLPTINMTRARSEGVPPLNVFRRQLFNSTNDGQLAPYKSWVDFGENIKHPESLVNFVAAYGQHPSILNAAPNNGPDGIAGNQDDNKTVLAAKRFEAKQLVNPSLGDTTVPADAAAFMNSTGAWANNGTTSRTGLDKVDLWVGGLAEVTNPFGGLLGTTFNYVFENQMTDLQNGDRLYYLARTPGMNLRTQLEGNSFAELMMRNTNVSTLKADAFATADCKFELKNLNGTPAGFAASGNTVADDPNSECNETNVLIRQPDGTIQYRAVNADDPPGINGQAVYNGTDGVDRMRGGNDNDTFWGGLGNDVVEGGAGADVALGGDGDDIITDLGGDDVPKGGPGNDAIDAGPGLDIVMGGEGKDFTNGGANANETFGGADDDFIYLGQSLDAAFGDSGNDWEEGGDQPDLMQGDSGNLFFLDDSQTPGHDILIGQGGDDDYDMEGGNDIGVGGSGIEKVAGASGYDWEIGQGEPQKQDMDLALPIAPLDILTAGVRDKFNEVEALSGWNFDDTLRGDDLIPAEVGGAGFIGCDVLDQQGLDLVAGLDPLVPALTTPLSTVVGVSASKNCPILSGNVWGAGNVLLGGAGSDLIEGRGGDDIIDGDKYVGVRLSVRNTAGTEVGSASIEGSLQSAMTSQYQRDANGVLTGNTLQQDVFAGVINPGNIVAVREILTGTGGTNNDVALFSGPRTDYTIGAPGTVTGADPAVLVTDNTGADGVDTLRNIETLRFTDGDVPLTAPDTTVPTVTARSPLNGAVGVALDANITATFSESVQGVTGTTFTVQQGANPVLTGVVTPAGGIGTTFTLDPAANLAPSTVYTVTLTGGAAAIRDSAGNPLVTATWTFTTAAPVVTVPDAPVIGAATAGNAQATVTWTAPANNGGAAISGYEVRVVDPANAQVGALRPAAAGATSLVVTGLTNGTAYRFQVRATNSAGPGAFSALSTAVTPAAAPVVTAPAAPTIGTATAGNAQATATWSAPANNGGAAISGYEVRVVDPANAQVGALRPAAAGATSLVVTGLTNGTAYRFQVRAANSAGPGAFSALSTAVTPAAAGDTTAPTVGGQAPANNATGVAVASNLTATFNEAVTGVTTAGNVTVRVGTTTAGALVASAVTYNTATRVMTINPTANLTADTRYTVRLTGGIRDAASNALVATSWTFLTGAVPVITARAPANNATGSSLTNNLTVTFSEAVNGVSGTTFVLRRPDGSTFPSVVSRNGTTNQWILNPTGSLLADTRYTVALTGGATAIRDIAGNPFVTPTWTFLTGPVPTVSTRTPAINTTGISRTANITTTLSEAPLASTVNGTNVVLTNTATGAVIAKVTSLSARIITINPNATLAANTQFTVRISGVTDVAGNPLPVTTWNFRTGA